MIIRILFLSLFIILSGCSTVTVLKYKVSCKFGDKLYNDINMVKILKIQERENILCDSMKSYEIANFTAPIGQEKNSPIIGERWFYTHYDSKKCEVSFLSILDGRYTDLETVNGIFKRQVTERILVNYKNLSQNAFHFRLMEEKRLSSISKAESYCAQLAR